MACSTVCDRCSKKFLNYRSLCKHRIFKHGIAGGEATFYFPGGDEVNVPQPRELCRNDDYLEWLSGVTERINGAHHPKFPGRWFRVEVNQTPKRYFHHIIWKLGVPLHSVRRTRHLRQPLISTNTIRYVYKIYDVDAVVDMFSEQKVTYLKRKTAFINEMETDAEADPALIEDPIAALEAAKRQANSLQRLTPTASSTVVVGEGEGRATREFELQWWPELYSNSVFGKVTFRFFVEKVSFS